MDNQNIAFCFKGQRNYVHGTDIYNRLYETVLKDQIQSDASFDLSFHGVATTNLKCLETPPEDENLLKFACKYFDQTGERKILYGVENNEAINCRYEYPEENICSLSTINTELQKISLAQDSSFSFIENCVALNKFLLETLFPDVNGKWYFTRLQLKKFQINTIYPLEIRFQSNFNFKLLKSEIYVEDESVGFIYFSLVS